MFKKAERKLSRIKLAITGPSGSGKTWGALTLASSLGKRIAVIDSENGSASLYSDHFEFDVLELNPPYSVEKYIRAIDLAIEQKYDVVVIDSISHAWAGEGGLLSVKESLDSRPRSNSFTNWGQITKMHERFKAKILSAPFHIICTIRSKQGYIIAEKDGKQVPQKVGMDVVQREGIEYEFTTVFDLAMNHEVEVSKDRTGLFADKFFKITKQTGEQIKNWLSVAKQEPPPPPPPEKKQIINYADQIGKKQAEVISDPPPSFEEVPDPLPEDMPPDVDSEFDQQQSDANTGEMFHEEQPKQETKQPKKNTISTAQQKRLFAISKESGYTYEHLKEMCAKGLGVESTSDIPWSKYSKLVELIEMRLLVDQIIEKLKG